MNLFNELRYGRFRTWVFWALFFSISTLLNAQSQPVPRGTPGDLWADVVLGQADNGVTNAFGPSAFGEYKINEANNHSMYNSYGIVVDPNHGILYLWDAGNSRVLGIPITNLSSNYAQSQPGYQASIVLGQPDFTHTAPNGDANWQSYPAVAPAAANYLNGSEFYQESPGEVHTGSEMALDPDGDLYVADVLNNRVLRFEYSTLSGSATVMGPNASYVWGQIDSSGNPSFTFNAPNEDGNNVYFPKNLPAPSNNNFNFNGAGGVGIDSFNNLWVADRANNRVLRFPNPSPGTCCPAQAVTADVVLGENDFNVGSGVTMFLPQAVRVDQAGDVYAGAATDGYNTGGGVFIYQPNCTGCGQPVYGTNNKVVLPNSIVTTPLGIAAGLEWDANGLNGTPPGKGIGGAPTANGTGGLWVSDPYGRQIVLFQIQVSSWNAAPASTPAIAPVKVLLKDEPVSIGGVGSTQVSFVDSEGDSLPSWLPSVSPSGAVGVDASGNVYMANSYNDGSGVFRFPAPIPQPTPNSIYSADVAVLKPDQFKVANSPGYHGFDGATGVAVASWKGVTQVMESHDVGNLPMRFWNMPSGGPSSFQNGQRADGIVGSANPGQPFIGPNGGFGRIRSDKVGHLWAICGENGAGYNYQNWVSD